VDWISEHVQQEKMMIEDVRTASDAEMREYCRYVANCAEGERPLTFTEWKNGR
jgi:hypothetical protein